MRWRPQTWLLLSILLFLASGYVWWLADRWEERKGAERSAEPPTEAEPARSPASNAVGAPPSPSSTLRLLSQPAAFAAAQTQPAPPAPGRHFPHRLSNTSKTVGQLARLDTAILLENALIDTAQGVALPIPEHLRARGGHGSYIVQSRGPLDDSFRALLGDAGARIISYIPQNAYLVRVSVGGARRLAAQPQTRAVLPYEPYYKLKPDLLALAVEQAPLPEESALDVVLFADAREATMAELEQMGVEIVGEDRSPFGPVLTVRPPVGALSAVAGLSGVQLVELYAPRVLANDLSRVRLGVSTNNTVALDDFYLGLTGTNVLVGVSDSGVDTNHPDLSPRVLFDLPTSGVDSNGHGTHVAGIIASSGEFDENAANASGSILGPPRADFRGKAPAARIFSISVDLAVGPRQSDAYLQETVARTNVLISNNSWHLLNNNSYGIRAAGYDAAARDALPTEPGSQPVLFVFPAGNAGQGNNSGLSGEPESILSPGTAKNVITVGAIEQPRNITNEVVIAGTTNAAFLGETDSANQVAAFSGRGNVGIGIEGDFGRVKPDLVAPGTMVVSTRSTHWNQQSYYNPTNHSLNAIRDIVVETNALFSDSIFIPDNAVGFTIRLLPNPDSPVPFPDLPILVSALGVPTNAASAQFIGTNQVSVPPDLPLNFVGWTWFYSVGNGTTQAVSLDILTDVLTTNDNGNFFEVLSNLNETIGPFYRYESGSSMAAAAVSGTLALMQEFFEQRLGRTNSPALMKALLLNGARSVGSLYDFQVQNLINHQGWGLVNVRNSLPGGLSNLVTQAAGPAPMLVFDQHPTNALATGQSHTRQLTLDPLAQALPLRVTLVWTDPPGNPSAGLKLVNDLDLVVTNLDTGEVFFGNDILADNDFNLPWDTNLAPNIDVVNNVENVYLAPPLGASYAVTVAGRRVNVNAVTAHTNTAQDYALVIASGNGQAANALTLSTDTFLSEHQPRVTVISNAFSGAAGLEGAILLNQRVGASPPLFAGVSTNGLTNQWQFYVLTNATGFTNAAFATFLPPTLSIPRIGVRERNVNNATRLEADIDLYVSTSPALTNLDPAAIANADKSRGRGGTESIVYSNSGPGIVYYVGVKSEDQQGAQFGFLGVISEEPFSEEENGNQILRGVPVPADIPDGTPADPGVTQIVAFASSSIAVRRVVVTNEISHQNFGDLLSQLSHGDQFAVLHNHTFGDGTTNQTFVYEDNEEEPLQRSDGPGGLRDFVGEDGAGVWLLTVLDDAFPHTGRVERLFIRLEPQGDTNGILATIEPGRFFFNFIDVPAEATNLTVSVSGNTQPVELFIRRGAFPSQTQFDKMAVIFPPGGSLSVNKTDLPPLTAGRYFYGVFNPPGNAPQTVRIVASVELDLAGVVPIGVASTGTEPILDDAVTTSTLFVTNRGKIVSVDVGLQIDHERVSDLAITLISPRGTRVLLSENRGGTNTGGFGGSVVTTNVLPQMRSGDFAATTNVINTGQNAGTLLVDYDFFTIPDTLRVYYDGVRIFDSGLISSTGRFNITYGPGISTDIAIVMNEGGNAATNTLWEYTATVISRGFNYFTFTENTNLTTTPIKFAVPPFSSGPSSNIFLSGFEGVAAGDYGASSSFDGWTVLTNQVSVISDPGLAQAGSNLLALADGQISRVLPTVGGRRYVLTYAVRGPAMISWWPANGAPGDPIGSNVGTLINGATYGPGKVGGQGFLFDGVNDSVQLGDPENLKLTNSFTIESWIFPRSYPTIFGLAQILFRGDTRFCLDPYSLSFTSVGGVRLHIETNSPCGVNLDTAPILTNQWRHVAGVFDAPQGRMRVYIDGVLAGERLTGLKPFRDLTGGGVAIGNHSTGYDTQPFNGIIDELSVYGRAVSVSELAAIFRADSLGKADTNVPPTQGLAKLQISVDGSTVAVVTGDNTNWQTKSVTFVAPRNNSLLEVAGLEPGTLMDAFLLADVGGDNFVLPEESLKALTGESAFGEWKLEIWDNRADAAILGPQLVSWQLQFIFETTVPAPIRLVHGVGQTNSVGPGEIRYFIVDVPAWASFATNSLLWAAAPLNLLFNQNAPPAPGATSAGDFTLLAGLTSGSVTLATNGLPPLLPGRQYYLGVHNPNPTNVDFAIQVDFDITPLTNAVPLTSTMPVSTLPRYFSYDVSSNATAVLFELFNLSGNVHLVARQGAPVPTLSSFDYRSASPGTNDETILVLTNSLPVPLAPGRWFLGVFNVDAVPVDYTIQATELTNVFPTIITLTNAIPYFATNAAIGTNLTDFYRFVVSTNAVRVQFEINDPTADVTLVARKGLPLPDLATFDYLSANTGTNDELIVFYDFSSPVPLTPGEWFLSAVNISGVPAAYVIKATEWPVHGTNLLLRPFLSSSNTFCVTWNSLIGAHYVVQGVPDLNTTNWNDISLTITAVSTQTTWCVALPSFYHFFRVREGLALTASVSPVRISSVAVTPGGVVLSWISPTNQQFQVQWTPTLAPPAWNTFTNVITSTTGTFTFTDDGSQTSGLGAMRYYRLLILP